MKNSKVILAMVLLGLLASCDGKFPISQYPAGEAEGYVFYDTLVASNSLGVQEENEFLFDGIDCPVILSGPNQNTQSLPYGEGKVFSATSDATNGRAYLWAHDFLTSESKLVSEASFLKSFRLYSVPGEIPAFCYSSSSGRVLAYCQADSFEVCQINDIPRYVSKNGIFLEEGRGSGAAKGAKVHFAPFGTDPNSYTMALSAEMEYSPAFDGYSKTLYDRNWAFCLGNGSNDADGYYFYNQYITVPRVYFVEALRAPEKQEYGLSFDTEERPLYSNGFLYSGNVNWEKSSIGVSAPSSIPLTSEALKAHVSSIDEIEKVTRIPETNQFFIQLKGRYLTNNIATNQLISVPGRVMPKEGNKENASFRVPLLFTERYDFYVEYAWDAGAKDEEDTLIRLIRAPHGTQDYSTLRTKRAHKRTFDYDFFPLWIDCGQDKVLFRAC
ncbi:MAG: hypothetical protein SOV58_06385 [Candidatus Enteromonas sp.]|nr:hypothetical protein [Candidatus Enteromonas sp.]